MYQIGEEEIEAVTRVIRSKKLFRYQGPGVPTECSAFESEFAQYLGQGHALMVNTGTNALVASLKALGIGPGDEVLVPCFTFVATPAAVLQCGATPVMINIDQHLGISTEDILRKVTPKTKAIIAVHMDGLNCQMDRISEIAKNNKLYLIEDVAQAIGGEYQGKKLGTFGDAGCFSFNAEKTLTCGEGGALVCKNEDTYKKALLAHDVAASFGSTFKDYLSSLNPEVGGSMRASEISGAIMRVQLKKMDAILSDLRQRKYILVDMLKPMVIEAWDPIGDSATSLHLHLNDPVTLAQLSSRLSTHGIKCIPASARPAHAYWHWSKLLKLSDSAEKQMKQDLAPSKLFLSSVLKIFVDPGCTLENTRSQAELLKSILNG